ncbi:VOC family protein [Luteolibacter ambystomatis]|uniref:VOC family protein n=1 Tax=Luteolibacter ambystomatis TaxID=2824561 RepID=A0A975J278_9BACT|nr:VOC family protein [Luteolibacter ambystomatis]QUE52685.1 VOC family protein [Luteolibacter ambystomatis]
MKVRKMDHVGVIVEDLAAATEFFVDLGFEVLGKMDGMQGEWLDRIVGLQGVRTSIVMLGAPDGGSNVELAKFHTAADERGIRPEAANALGIRHLAFVVEGIDAIVAKLKSKGVELFSEVETYEDCYKLLYVRGPEGIIIELAEEIG